MKIWKVIFAVGCGLIVAACGGGGSDNATPTPIANIAPVVNGDGTVTYPTTGLMWMRCSIGQTWDGTTCTGTAGTYTWDEANALTSKVTFAGQSDWRLPNIRELTSIPYVSGYGSAIDPAVFPNNSVSSFWSASAYVGNSIYAWLAGSGHVDYYMKYDGIQVRLVRAGQSFGLLDMARPSSDYVDLGNGTVKHTPTGLIWQRCAVGQSWTGSTCSGTASTFTWDAAKLLTSSFAGKTDWHLPTEDQLLSLADYRTYSPAINTTMFPNTTDSGFWSASAATSSSDYAWVVFFKTGWANVDKTFTGYQVRLLRT